MSFERVKIIATVGPASATPEIIGEMIEAGVDVFRINFSHGEHDEHKRTYRTIREEAERADAFVAILADLCGPKIRTGKVEGGQIPLVEGATLTITAQDVLGNETTVSTSYKGLHRDVKPSDRILLDDGMLELEVERIEGENIVCTIAVGGVLKDRKGMNIPGSLLSLPALTDKDKRDLEFARELGVDFFALSFVRRPEDVIEAKALAGEIPVIAKIEKPEAIENLAEIVSVADGMMVARGDLGVEAGPEKVPLIQKRIIRDANASGLPVIVATQMLETMISNPKPTRAEVSDVANAVLDGTDAVMLSGETAVGKYPVKAVRSMAGVLAEIEESDVYRNLPDPEQRGYKTFSGAIARSAVTASADLDLKAIAVYTDSGRSASLVSACRPHAHVVAFSRHESVLRRLALRWGVFPLRGEWVESIEPAITQAKQSLKTRGLVSSGDAVAVMFGQEGPEGFTDTLRLVEIS